MAEFIAAAANTLGGAIVLSIYAGAVAQVAILGWLLWTIFKDVRNGQ